MSFTYTYRPEMGITNSVPMRAYDRLFQRNEAGHGIGWYVGLWFPVMAAEERLPRHKVAKLVHELDRWMAAFLMENQVRWESRNGNS